MKSKIEVRVFAVNKAVEIMGTGAPAKDVVTKAQEIEQYIMGDAELPDVYAEESPANFLNSIASVVSACAASQDNS